MTDLNRAAAELGEYGTAPNDNGPAEDSTALEDAEPADDDDDEDAPL